MLHSRTHLTIYR